MKDLMKKVLFPMECMGNKLKCEILEIDRNVEDMNPVKNVK